MEATVSIVTPCYNSAAYLGEAVESALAQTRAPLEMLVVDDGSTDRSCEIARSYGPPVRLLQQSHQGPCAARNLGIEQARGRYVLFLDADDLLHATAVERLVSAIADRDDRMAVMGWRFCREGAPLDQAEEHFPPEKVDAIAHLLHDNLAPLHAFLCPTEAVRKVGGFDVTIPFCEDWHVWLQLALAGLDVVTVRFAGAYYRIHSDCRSSDAGQMLEGRLELLLRAHEEICGRPELLEVVGNELYEAECGAWRRCYARQFRGDRFAKLVAAMRQLRGKGFHRRRSAGMRVLDGAFGRQADRVVMNLYRLLKPSVFAMYREQ